MRPSIESSISFAVIKEYFNENAGSEDSSPNHSSNDMKCSTTTTNNNNNENDMDSDDKIFIDLESPKTIHPYEIEEEKQLLQYTNHFMDNKTKDEEYIQNLDNNLELVRKDLLKNSFLLNVKQENKKSKGLNYDKFNISDYYIRSESPISLSGNHTPSITYGSNGSNSNHDSDIETDMIDILSKDTKKERYSKEHKREHSHTSIQHSDHSLPSYKSLKHINYKSKGFKYLSYEDVEKSLSKYYDKENRFSNEMDLLITYLKGQKNLYTQCKNFSQSRLNCLFLPSLFITSIVALLSNYNCHYNLGGIVLSCLNAVAAVLISLINYLKLETKTDNYDRLANEYDKLETSLELASNRLFFYNKSETQTKKDIKKQNHSLLTKIKDTEDKISEIKENYSTLVPEYIKKIFPVICHINIFSFIQKIENYKKMMIFEFRDIKNEIRYMMYKWNQRDISIFDEIDENSTIELQRDKYRFAQLIQVKEEVKKKLINYKNAYSYIDEIFSREIKNAESCYHWIFLFFFCKSVRVKYNYSNPVISEFLRLVFTEDS
jgi:hypothetical protein